MGPWGISLDSQGNLFIADYDDHRIRKVDTNGTITTIAGTGTSGFSGDGGPATSAQINLPYAVTVDTSGNIFIADYGNARVRRIDAGGTITTIAGTGTRGYNGDNISAVSAQLYGATSVLPGPSNALYFSDSGNSRVRKIDANGIITTVAGDGQYEYSGENVPATSASFLYPEGIAFDPQGNLLIVDLDDSRLRKVDTNGIVRTMIGTGVSGYNGDNLPLPIALLNGPVYVITDNAGDIYVSDGSNAIVRRVSATSTGNMTLTLTSP